MNTQLAFAFGMLAMVAITMLVVIVVGMLKVIKQQSKITSLEEWINGTNRLMENNRQELERRITEEVRILADEIGHVHRIMDSRFDKYEKKIVTAAVNLINLQNNTQEAIKTNKQILKD